MGLKSLNPLFGTTIITASTQADFNKFQASFQMPKTKWEYHKGAFNFKQGDEETVNN